MPTINLNLLEPHPDNANRMSDAFMAKLAAHIRITNEYPPLIVRHHPTQPNRFQILDGHHRAMVLRDLGHTEAHCEVWDVDDDRAALLLLSLNRLHGEDDPQLRGSLLSQLSQTMSIEHLASLLPDTHEQIQGLLDLCAAPPPLVKPPQVDDMPHTVTFFLRRPHRDALLKRLKTFDPDPSAALVSLLSLDAVGTSRHHA